MQLPRTLALLAAFLAPLAPAKIIIGEEICLTSYGTKSVNNVPTHKTRQVIDLTLASTKTVHKATTVTPTITVTVPTVQIDTTTLAQETNTITSTVTTTTTSTLVVDVSQTNTVEVITTITQQPTVTASTAPNFTPFASEPAVIAAGGGTSSKKRREAPRLRPRGLGDLTARSPGLNKNKSGPLYPQSVECVVYAEHIVTQVTTVTSARRTRTAPVVIATSTSIETITSTIVPEKATTTLTTTATATSLSVSVNVDVTTVTSTSTSTSFAGATVTYYPQCQSDNLITYVGGKPLYYLQSNNPTLSPTSDAVTCCQICANTDGCAGFSGPTPGFTDCYILGDGGTCDASQVDWTVYLASGQTSDLDVVGNGNCGQGAYGGSLQ